MSNTRSNLPESVRRLTIMESRGDAKNADSDSKNSNTGDDITLVSSRRAGNNKVSQHSRYAHKRSFSLGGVQPLRNRSVHPRDGRTTILEQQKKERLLREKAEELVCIIRSGNVSQLGPFLPMIQQIDRLDLEVALVCEAVKSGNETMLRVLLEAGACVSRPDRHFFRPLHYAASTGQTEVVQILLDAGSFVDAREGTGCTPLYYSMRKGYPASSALLLNAKADPTNAGYAGRSAFHAACINTENDHLSCIEILLGLDRALASLNRESEQGKKPVDVCAQYGTLPALKLLLKDDRIVTDWKTLDCAVQRKCGAQAVFRLLLEKGTQFGAGGASGKSAPEMTLSALKAGNVGVLGLFLDAGYVSVSASTIKVACQQNNPQLVELLLKHSTALEGTMLSASSSGNPLLFDMIMQAGGNICEKDAMGNTVLFQRSFNKDIYEYSLRAGVDIEAVNYRGRTALLEAARFCGSYQWAIDKLQFFVDNKAKTEVATPDGVTVWHLLTVPRCYPQAIKILCRSAHTSLTSGKGLDSPLHVFVRRYLALEPAMYAEKRAVLHACYLLLRYGADANETGFDGKTALQLAAVHDNDQGSDKGQSAADKKRTSDCNRNRIRNCQPSGTTDGANESDAEIGQHRRLYRPFKKWLTLLLRREAQMSPEGLFCCAGVRTIRVAVDSRLHSNTPVFAVDGVDGQSTVKQIINRVRHELEIRVDMGLTLQSMKGEDVLEEHLTLAALHLIPEHDRLGGHRESDHDKFGHKDSDTSPAEPALHVIPMMDISPSQFLEFYSAAYGDTF